MHSPHLRLLLRDWLSTCTLAVANHLPAQSQKYGVDICVIELMSKFSFLGTQSVPSISQTNLYIEFNSVLAIFI